MARPTSVFLCFELLPFLSLSPLLPFSPQPQRKYLILTIYSLKLKCKLCPPVPVHSPAWQFFVFAQICTNNRCSMHVFLQVYLSAPRYLHPRMPLMAPLLSLSLLTLKEFLVSSPFLPTIVIIFFPSVNYASFNKLLQTPPTFFLVPFIKPIKNTQNWHSAIPENPTNHKVGSFKQAIIAGV